MNPKPAPRYIYVVVDSEGTICWLESSKSKAKDCCLASDRIVKYQIVRKK